MALNDVDSSVACFLKALELEPADGNKPSISFNMQGCEAERYSRQYPSYLFAGYFRWNKKGTGDCKEKGRIHHTDIYDIFMDIVGSVRAFGLSHLELEKSHIPVRADCRKEGQGEEGLCKDVPVVHITDLFLLKSLIMI